MNVKCENEELEKKLQMIFDEMEKKHKQLYEKYKHEGVLDGHNREHMEISKAGFKKIDKLKDEYGDGLEGAVLCIE